MENKDFEIEIQEEQEQDTSSVQLPLNFLTLGEIENDDVKVYIKQDVYKALEKLSASDTKKELGSIILGDYVEEHGKMHVVISEYIEAKYTDASAATLTFTHETWDYIHKEHEKEYPDKKIIGWQHTHPNYGIFLSNYDLFIQENFFNLPFQVAYVIDPIQNIRGFFQWKNGKIEKLKGYYIYDEIGKPIKIEQKKIDKNSTGKAGKGYILLISLLCVLSLVLGITLISTKSNFQKELAKVTKEKQEIIDQQTEEISTLQAYLVQELENDYEITTAEDLIKKMENKEIQLSNQEALLKELKAYVAENGDKKSVGFEIYTVKDGDTLLTICAEKGIDYKANSKIILSMNGIKNINKILVGQQIILPVVK